MLSGDGHDYSSSRHSSVYICKAIGSPLIPMGTSMIADVFVKLLLPLEFFRSGICLEYGEKCKLLWRISETPYTLCGFTVI